MNVLLCVHVCVCTCVRLCVCHSVFQLSFLINRQISHLRSSSLSLPFSPSIFSLSLSLSCLLPFLLHIPFSSFLTLLSFTLTALSFRLFLTSLRHVSPLSLSTCICKIFTLLFPPSSLSSSWPPLLFCIILIFFLYHFAFASLFLPMAFRSSNGSDLSS